MKKINVFNPYPFGWCELISFYILSVILLFIVYKLNNFLANRGGYLNEVIGVCLSLSLGMIYFIIFAAGDDFFIGRLFIEHGNESFIRYSGLFFSFLCLAFFPIKRKK